MKSNSTQVKTTGFEQAQELAVQIPSMIEKANESSSAVQLAHRRYGFSIGNFHFLAPHGVFCELLVDIDITPLPGAPSHFVGLANHRGNILPIYTLAPLLGIASIKSKYAYLLGQPADGAAILINDKPSLIDLSEAETVDNTQENLPGILEQCVDFTQADKNTSWHAIKHESLFRQLANAR